MRKPIFRTDDEWRTVVVMELLSLRRSVFEFGFLISIIAMGMAVAKWWNYAPMAAAVISFLGAVFFYKGAVKDWNRLADLHVAADME